MLHQTPKATQVQLRALIKMELYSYGRSLKENLSKKLTVFFCSLVVLALILHLYHDFVANHLAGISMKLSQTYATFAVFALLGVGSFFLRAQVKTFLNSPETPRSFAKSLGESKKILKIFTYLSIPFLFLISYMPFWAIALYLFGDFSLIQQFLLLVLPPFLLIFTFIKKTQTGKSRARAKTKLLIKKNTTPTRALLLWRIKQMIYRNKLTKALLLMSFLLASSSPIFLAQSKSNLYSLGFTFLSSLLAGASLLIQVGKDFKSIWLERVSGVSHEDYFKTILQLSNLTGLCLAFLTSFTFFSTSFFFPLTTDYPTMTLVKLALLAYVPVNTVPLVALQIDPRKVLLHTTILSVLSLFFCSFLLIQPLLFLLFPFVLSYAKQSQENRFYTI